MITEVEAKALAKAIAHVGGCAAMARTLAEMGHTVRSGQTVQHWKVCGIPAEYVPTIERLTGVRSEHLRRDVNWHFLRKSYKRPLIAKVA